MARDPLQADVVALEFKNFVIQVLGYISFVVLLNKNGCFVSVVLNGPHYQEVLESSPTETPPDARLHFDNVFDNSFSKFPYKILVFDNLGCPHLS